MITCEQIEGPCCDSCHEDYQNGWDGGGYDEMCMLYDEGSNTAFAHVCCRKVEDAERHHAVQKKKTEG